MTNPSDYDIINTQDKTTTVYKTRKEKSMALKQNEILAEVKKQVFDLIKPLADNHSGEQYADYAVAIPVTLEGQEYWGCITITCGQIKDTKKNSAFDPFEKQADWLAEKQFKKEEAERKAKAKAEKIERSKKNAAKK